MLRAAACLDRVMTPGIHLIKFLCCLSQWSHRNKKLSQWKKKEKKKGKEKENEKNAHFTSHIVYTLLSNYFTLRPPLAINRQVTSLEILKSLFSCI